MSDLCVPLEPQATWWLKHPNERAEEVPMSEEPLGFTISEEYTLEKIRTGETEPYEVVTFHADGTRTVWRRDEDQ